MSEIVCQSCGKPAPRAGRAQKYCSECSRRKAVERKTRWSNGTGARRYVEGRSAIAERGAEISSRAASSLLGWPMTVKLAWAARVAVPFDWAASKNHTFTIRKEGHVELRAEARAFRQMLGLSLKRALAGTKVVQNKVWLDILIQKPNQRGDAANFVDLICDAVKDVIGVDDRWYSIRFLDWQIVKTAPQIIVGVGQEDVRDAQACSSCGRILGLDQFHKNKALKAGVGRNCLDCSSARTKRRADLVLAVPMPAPVAQPVLFGEEAA